MSTGACPLNNDGIVEAFYGYMWSKDEHYNSCKVYVPDTVIFRLHSTANWYFSSKRDGYIKKKMKQQLRAKAIWDGFTTGRSPKDSDILAMYISKQEEVEDGPKVTRIEYLNKKELENFLFIRKKNDGILQRFVEPKGPRNFLIRATWTPLTCVLERRTSNRRLHDYKYDVYERAVTYEGSDFHSKIDPIKGAFLPKRIAEICETIVRHCYRFGAGRPLIERMVCYFKIDDAERIWFLYSSACRVKEKLLPGINMKKSAKINLFSEATVASHVNMKTVSVSSQPRKLQKSFVCPRCGEWLEDDQTFPISYKQVIAHHANEWGLEDASKRKMRYYPGWQPAPTEESLSVKDIKIKYQRDLVHWEKRLFEISQINTQSEESYDFFLDLIGMEKDDDMQEQDMMNELFNEATNSIISLQRRWRAKMIYRKCRETMALIRRAKEQETNNIIFAGVPGPIRKVYPGLASEWFKHTLLEDPLFINKHVSVCQRCFLDYTVDYGHTVESAPLETPNRQSLFIEKSIWDEGVDMEAIETPRGITQTDQEKKMGETMGDINSLLRKQSIAREYGYSDINEFDAVSQIVGHANHRSESLDIIENLRKAKAMKTKEKENDGPRLSNVSDLSSPNIKKAANTVMNLEKKIKSEMNKRSARPVTAHPNPRRSKGKGKEEVEPWMQLVKQASMNKVRKDELNTSTDDNRGHYRDAIYRRRARSAGAAARNARHSSVKHVMKQRINNIPDIKAYPEKPFSTPGHETISQPPALSPPITIMYKPGSSSTPSGMPLRTAETLGAMEEELQFLQEKVADLKKKVSVERKLYSTPETRLVALAPSTRLSNEGDDEHIPGSSGKCASFSERISKVTALKEYSISDFMLPQM